MRGIEFFLLIYRRGADGFAIGVEPGMVSDLFSDRKNKPN
jgi:hypothetical protein